MPEPVEPGPQGTASTAGSRMMRLIAGTARAGVGFSFLVASDLTSRSVSFVRVVLPSGLADAQLDAIERQIGRRQDEVRESEQWTRDDVAKAAESALNRVVVEIVDMLDMEQLIDHVPINRVVARVDVPAVIDEIDLSGIVRAGTKGLGGETVDGARSGLMALDLWTAHLVDRILRRKDPRDLEVRRTMSDAPSPVQPK